MSRGEVNSKVLVSDYPQRDLEQKARDHESSPQKDESAKMKKILKYYDPKTSPQHLQQFNAMMHENSPHQYNMISDYQQKNHSPHREEVEVQLASYASS